LRERGPPGPDHVLDQQQDLQREIDPHRKQRQHAGEQVSPTCTKTGGKTI
jgi:hypothetical protein